jgi:hypothetical protein
MHFNLANLQNYQYLTSPKPVPTCTSTSPCFISMLLWGEAYNWKGPRALMYLSVVHYNNEY